MITFYFISTLICFLLGLLLFIKRNRFYNDSDFEESINSSIPRFFWIIFLILLLIPVINIIFIVFIYWFIITALLEDDLYYKTGKLSSKLLKPL